MLLPCAVDAIFGAMTECQALHPDDTMEEFEEDEYDGEDAEGMSCGTVGEHVR
jgi:hypothetical protein